MASAQPTAGAAGISGRHPGAVQLDRPDRLVADPLPIDSRQVGVAHKRATAGIDMRGRDERACGRSAQLGKQAGRRHDREAGSVQDRAENVGSEIDLMTT